MFFDYYLGPKQQRTDAWWINGPRDNWTRANQIEKSCESLADKHGKRKIEVNWDDKRDDDDNRGERSLGGYKH